MDLTWIHDYDTEPDYMRTEANDKKKTLKWLLIFPIFTMFVFAVLTIGEIFPSSNFPSATKIQYIIKSNSIAKDLINGNSENIINHILLYYDNHKTDFITGTYIDSLYENTLNALTTAEDSLQNTNCSTIMNHIQLSSGGCYYVHSNAKSEDLQRWQTVGFLTVNDVDVAIITITFLSLNNYTVSLEMITPSQDDKTDEEFQQLLSEYKSSDMYKIWSNAANKMVWFEKILSQQPDDFTLVTKVLNSDKKTKENIEQYFTSKFINGANVSAYIQNFTEALYSLSDIYTFGSITNSNLVYNQDLNCFITFLNFNIRDSQGVHGNINVKCLYNCDGYQIIPGTAILTNELGFDEPIAKQFVERMNNNFV